MIELQENSPSSRFRPTEHQFFAKNYDPEKMEALQVDLLLGHQWLIPLLEKQPYTDKYVLSCPVSLAWHHMA